TKDAQINPSPRLALSHDNLGLEDAGLDLLVREHHAAVAVDLVADVHVLAEDGHVLDARPHADGGVPPDDAAGDARVLLDAGAAHHRAPGQPHPGLHHAPGANGDVRPDQATLADDGGLVDEHVAQDVRARRELGGRLLPKRVEVQPQPGDVVPRLPDVHPEPRQDHGEQAIVRGDAREHLLLDGRGLQLDAVQHRRVEQVDAGVDLVADEHLGLLHEALHLVGLILHDHHAILRCLVIPW
ncbi:Os03g0268450, partial [Oryza sativa Japonica Group]